MSEQSSQMTQLLSFFKVSSKSASASVKKIEQSKYPVKTTAKKPVASIPSSNKPKSDSSDEWEEF